ncbi:sodium:calcium antiporter [Marinobacterium sp. D7]|uniref:sodium:calcium antiporter n=1 Tax=Marinobacterium ramblicola TaxID=2849041 RepID=UPI001C2DE158|nr:sodium:calcium antiporter [Marinobacterium ramblicola]MBV1786645.1 sodium:calcium antiporter [Marinobacterium ramblicola]
MPVIDTGSLWFNLTLFTGCALAILVTGTRITRIVDQLADRIRIGEALAGGVLMGAATSLSGSVLSVTAAWNGHPELAVSNALGGIAVQTVFLAIADITYRRANLEHAAASAENMMQTALLIALLALIALAPLLPDFTLWEIHPLTFCLILLYLYGLGLVKRVRDTPLWRAAKTRSTRPDIPESSNTRLSLPLLLVNFLVLMLLLGLSGWLLEHAASALAEQTGLGETLIGVLLTATSTSLPELVTCLAAVRRGALTLAVGGIIGGNAFDTLFTAASDIAYRDGSIYHVMSDTTLAWTLLTLLMSAFLMMGLIRREERGFARIGFESLAVLLLYALGLAVLLI